MRFLASKPSGCVIFLRFDQHSLDLGPFAFFGEAPGEPLPDLTGMKIATYEGKTLRGSRRSGPTSEPSHSQSLRS
jgi:hypothetical protein